MSMLALQSSRIVTPEGLRAGVVVLRDAAIVEVAATPPAGIPTEDLGNLVIMPGLVDPHVHVNEPGHTEWEGFATATRAAAAGGVTTIVDMPLNSLPVTTTVAALEAKQRTAQAHGIIQCEFWGGLIPNNLNDLPALLAAGVRGIKCFLIDSGLPEFPAVGEAELRAALPILAAHGGLLLAHAEWRNAAHPDEAAAEDAFRADPRNYQRYVATRPDHWECEAIALLLQLAAEYRARVHIVHLATASALPQLAIGKHDACDRYHGPSMSADPAAAANGRPRCRVTVETCPHYLYFAAEEIPYRDARYKCAPPIRSAANRENLWQGLCDGTIDFIASDHSPAPPELKCLETGNLIQAWGGIASLQLTLPVVWTGANARGFGLRELTMWLSTRPADFIGLGNRKGRIAPGYDADLVVWDPDTRFTVTPEMLHCRHPSTTPYLGQQLQGLVQRTYYGGKRVY